MKGRGVIVVGSSAERAAERVLVAEDNPDTRRYLQELLARTWYVEAVSDGEAALDSALSAPPALVLADVRMPKLDGFSLLRQLRDNAQTQDVPIILLSARADETARVEGLEAGADDYLAKPFSARELVAKINALLRLARLRRESLAAQRQSQRLESFLLKLSDTVRPLAEPSEIQGTVTRIACEFFHADRCYFCEVEGDQLVVRQDYARGDGSSVSGSYDARNYPRFAEVIQAAEPFSVSDAREAHHLDPELIALWLSLGLVSLLLVPVQKRGRVVGLLCITQSEPRVWSESEVALAMETAERTWTAVERARAEAQVRDSEARLLESDRRKDEFLAMLGHELRNPLGAIRNATQLLGLLPSPDPRLDKARGVLERQSNQMARLIDSLLEITRIARGKVRLNRETLDARALLEAVVEDRQAQAERDGLALSVELPSGPAWVEADPVRVAQVLDNLLGNAMKFTEAGGRVHLSLLREDGDVIFVVRDTGCGMQEETLEQLFDPFSQESQELDRSRGGLGLGLAVAKGLVELHKGSIDAHSDGPGQGSTFTVRLPLTRAPERRAGDDEPAELSHRRILLVEDNEDAAQSMRDLLLALGHTVEAVSNGPDALAALERRSFDVVLCDLGLPGMNGYEIAEAIRQNASLEDTGLVAVSGYGQPQDRKKSSAAGFDAHLVKPVELRELNQTLRSL